MGDGVSLAQDRLNKPRTCVIVSYWTGRPARRLHRLLQQMRVIEPGVPFDVVVACNGGDERPLTLPAQFDDLRPRVLNRENSHYNLGAWEYGWRHAGDYEFYLFLQDDCFLKRGGWLYDFEFRMTNDPGIGLLGEMIKYDAMTWEYLRETVYTRFLTPDPDRAEQEHPLDVYRGLCAERGIASGETGRHVPSIIMFTSRRVLEEVGGFPLFGPSYRHAIGTEIATSKLIESRGYRVAKVTDQIFNAIGHVEWTANGIGRDTGWKAAAREAWWKSRAMVRQTLGLRSKAKRGPMAETAAATR